MGGAAPVVLLLVFIAGVLFDSDRESQVILLPDPDGTVGVVAVSTAAGESILNQPGQMTRVGGASAVPSAPVIVDDADIEREFSVLFATEPPQPVKFILYFDPDSTRLTPVSQELLPEILLTIKQRESHAVGIFGHSDRTGSDEYNLRLSLQRSNAIRDLLAEQGVDLQTLDVASHGEGNPLIPTADDVAEPRNRRVEVIVR